LDEYIRRCERQIADWEKQRAALEGGAPLEIRRSVEYGSGIIHSIETGAPRVIYGNVPNDGLIDNLPHGCCVEVPCLVDKNGVQPTKVGSLPPQLAALMQTNQCAVTHGGSCADLQA
jgi:alpha-galactosidase